MLSFCVVFSLISCYLISATDIIAIILNPYSSMSLLLPLMTCESWQVQTQNMFEVACVLLAILVRVSSLWLLGRSHKGGGGRNTGKLGEPVKPMTFSNFRQLQGKKLLKTPRRISLGSLMYLLLGQVSQCYPNHFLLLVLFSLQSLEVAQYRWCSVVSGWCDVARHIPCRQ